MWTSLVQRRSAGIPGELVLDEAPQRFQRLLERALDHAGELVGAGRVEWFEGRTCCPSAIWHTRMSPAMRAATTPGSHCRVAGMSHNTAQTSSGVALMSMVVVMVGMCGFLPRMGWGF
jgi:hypothetical protein